MMTQAKTISLNSKVERRLNALDKKLNLLLEELKVYSDDQLNRVPKEGKWSVIQIMHHLLLVESASQDYITKKLSFNPELKKAGVVTSLRKITLKIALGMPFKFKAPKAVGSEQLPEFVRFWDEAKKWKEQRVELKAFLATLSDDVLGKEVYKHPAAGRMDVFGMLDFYDWHFDRHHRQIRRVVKEYAKQN